jgi:hypothetical protein
MHHRLPLREITGAVLVVPLAFLLSGVLRALWALRSAEHCSWSDALHALAIWFALSWVDTLAVIRGVVSGRAAFLRTPKFREGGNRVWPALRSSSTESLLAGLAVAGAIAMLIAAPAIATGILALMLLFEAWVFGSAPWASFAAEGIHLTPYREMYRRSAQNTGEWPQRRHGAEILSVGLILAVGLVLAWAVLNAPPESPAPSAQLPTIGTLTKTQPTPASSPTPTPAPSPTPTASSTLSPSPSPTVSTTASP